MMCCRYIDDVFTMHTWCIDDDDDDDDDSDDGGEVMIEVVLIRMMGTIMMRAA